MTDFVENIRLEIDERDIVIAFLLDFSVAFYCLYSSYIMDCMLDSGLSKDFVSCLGDSFTKRPFAVVGADGTLTTWFPYFRGFGRGSCWRPILQCFEPRGLSLRGFRVYVSYVYENVHDGVEYLHQESI